MFDPYSFLISLIYQIISLIIGVVIGTYIATKYVAFRVARNEIISLIQYLRKQDNFNEELSKMLDKLFEKIRIDGKIVADEIVGYIVEKYVSKTKNSSKTIPEPPKITDE